MFGYRRKYFIVYLHASTGLSLSIWKNELLRWARLPVREGQKRRYCICFYGNCFQSWTTNDKQKFTVVTDTTVIDIHCQIRAKMSILSHLISKHTYFNFFQVSLKTAVCKLFGKPDLRGSTWTQHGSGCSSSLQKIGKHVARRASLSSTDELNLTSSCSFMSPPSNTLSSVCKDNWTRGPELAFKARECVPKRRRLFGGGALDSSRFISPPRCFVSALNESTCPAERVFEPSEEHVTLTDTGASS